jgi:hypothetical protein
MDALQVYGGALAFVTGAHVWCSSLFRGISQVHTRESKTSGLSISMRNSIFINSQALTSTISSAISDFFDLSLLF